MKQILIESLKCVKHGKDGANSRNITLPKAIKLRVNPSKNLLLAKPCRLCISADGTLKDVLKNAMHPGKTWTIRKLSKFEKAIELKLFQEKMLIGTVEILPNLRFRGTIKFNGNGANFN